MVRDFYVGPFHRDMFHGMPWVTQWKVLMRSQQSTTEFRAPGSHDRVHFSVLAADLILSKVRGMESASREKEGVVTPKQLRISSWNDRGMHEFAHTV